MSESTGGCGGYSSLPDRVLRDPSDVRHDDHHARRDTGATPAAAAPARAAISDLVTKTIVYSTDPCSFCQRVKALLRVHGVEFEEINLSKDPAGRVELARRTGMMSFPQVLVGGRVIGGYAELQRAVDTGELDELLAT
jgi:glutaredoxin 3